SYVEMTRILRQQKKQREILPLLRRAIAVGCRDGDVLALLGRELINVRSFDEAIAYLSLALEVDPTHPTAFRDRVLAIKRRKALDTQLLKLFTAPRPRMAGSNVRISQEAPKEDDD